MVVGRGRGRGRGKGRGRGRGCGSGRQVAQQEQNRADEALHILQSRKDRFKVSIILYNSLLSICTVRY